MGGPSTTRCEPVCALVPTERSWSTATTLISSAPFAPVPMVGGFVRWLYRRFYHPAVGRHLSDGTRDAATGVRHRQILIGRRLVRDAKLRVVLAEAVDPVALFIGSLHSS